MLDSTMMEGPLTVPSTLERARLLFPDREIVSVIPTGFDREKGGVPTPGTHRTTYGQVHRWAMRLANALVGAGVEPGDRVATLALNHYRHLEAYFAVPATGAVLHTVNVRLHPEQILYVMNHAEDKLLLVDNLFARLVPSLLEGVPSIEKVVVMGPVPGGDPLGTTDYEDFIEGHSDVFTCPPIDERQASGMCYTSGTTGNPKGVLYSHRSTVLHALTLLAADVLGLSRRDAVLPVVPMFHVNAWGVPYAAAMTGAKQVFTSAFVDPKTLAGVLSEERATLGVGIPTIWMGLLEELDRAKEAGEPHDLSALRSLVAGGAPVPRAMIEAFDERHGVRVTHGWGMTETSPVGALNRIRPDEDPPDPEEKYDELALQGLPVPLVELKVVDDDGKELPRDGETMGRLLSRGPWVARGYHGVPDGAPEAEAFRMNEGWFDTGDIASINRKGYVLIRDRAKDLVKSGGEWISSVDLENALMAHPAVKEAAVIAVPHPRWDERPFGVLVLREGASASGEELNAFLEPRFAKFWLPDDYAFVKEIPRTTVGKWLKRELRERFVDSVAARERQA
jgi:fatty-acyl-CoA synthase